MPGESRSEDEVSQSMKNLACQVNFLLQKSVGELRPSKSLCGDLHPLVRALETYREVLETNGSIAKHLGLPLFIDKIESKVCGLFTTPYPCIVGTNEAEEQRVSKLSWLDLVQKEIPKEEFHHTAAETYSCRIGTTLVRMHEMDRDLICSGFILNLLRSRPDSSDVRKEQVTRKNLVADMNLLYNDCLRSKYSSSSSLYHLLKKKKKQFWNILDQSSVCWRRGSTTGLMKSARPDQMYDLLA